MATEQDESSMKQRIENVHELSWWLVSCRAISDVMYIRQEDNMYC